MTNDTDRIAALSAQNDALRKALAGVLQHERERAKMRGHADCCCMTFSREAARKYENGKCPHQLARAVMGKEPDGA